MQKYLFRPRVLHGKPSEVLPPGPLPPQETPDGRLYLHYRRRIRWVFPE